MTVGRAAGGDRRRLAPSSEAVRRPAVLALLAAAAAHALVAVAESHTWLRDALAFALGVDPGADISQMQTMVTLGLTSALVAVWARLRKLRYRQVIEAAEQFTDDVRDIFDGD